MTPRIAYFITPHGFGHAARAAGIMEALARINGEIQYEIFTLVPKWFFEASLAENFGYHALLTDIGLVQETALQENLPETLRRLGDFLPFDDDYLVSLAEKVTKLGCQMILCDIAPLGIAVAQKAGIPSILIENFTWEWIYEAYVAQYPSMMPYVSYLRSLSEKADYHVQTAPLCEVRPADLTTSPVSRAAKVSAAMIRRQLGIPYQAQVVMITMGGIQWHYSDLTSLAQYPDCYFIVPGASDQQERHGHLITLPHHSQFFHPDLINAADAVIGKVGYSTIAEIYQAGVPFGYIGRPGFRESAHLEAYLQQYLPSIPISGDQFAQGNWLSILPDLLALPSVNNAPVNGGTQAAEFVASLI